MVKFGTLEYYQKFAEAVNNDEEIAKSRLTTTIMDVFSDVKDSEGVSKAFLLTLENGKITNVREAKPDEKAEFTTTDDYKTLASIAKGEISSQKAHIKYPITKALKYMKTLMHLDGISRTMKDVEY